MSDVSQAPSPTGDGWHATFSPSSAERWINCPGSVALTRDLPESTSRYADEGTAAHILASRAFEYGKDADFWIGEDIQVGNSLFPVTADMAANVQMYVDDVRRRTGPNDTFMFEQRVWFSETIGAPEQGGTADCIILHDGAARLTVGDLKYGAGVEVSATANKQLGLYALGVLETFAAIMDDVQEVTVFICQPRIGGLSEYTFTRAELEALAAEARAAVINAEKALLQGQRIDEALFKVTEKGCQWCKAKAYCDAYRRFVSQTVMDDFEALDEPGIVAVSAAPAVPAAPSRLGQLSGVLDIVEGWCRGVRSEIERLVMAGTQVIGPDGQPMKVIEGKKGNRAWRDEASAADMLLTVLGPDKAYKPAKLVSPADVQKALGKKRKAEYDDLIAPLVTQAPGKPKIALGSDPAPPYTAQAGVDEFDDLGAE